MKRTSLIAFTILPLLPSIAFAAVGVSIGHHTYEADGFPKIGPGEQASVFVCKGKMRGSEAADCALAKCKKAFGVPDGAPVKTIGKTDLHGGKCSIDGWSQRKGHSIIMVGPKGDNRFIMSKALGDPTREEAMKFVRQNDFPVSKSTMVLDYYDKDGD